MMSSAMRLSARHLNYRFVGPPTDLDHDFPIHEPTAAEPSRTHLVVHMQCRPVHHDFTAALEDDGWTQGADVTSDGRTTATAKYENSGCAFLQSVLL